MFVLMYTHTFTLRDLCIQLYIIHCNQLFPPQCGDRFPPLGELWAAVQYLQSSGGLLALL